MFVSWHILSHIFAWCYNHQRIIASWQSLAEFLWRCERCRTRILPVQSGIWNHLKSHNKSQTKQSNMQTMPQFLHRTWGMIWNKEWLGSGGVKSFHVSCELEELCWSLFYAPNPEILPLAKQDFSFLFLLTVSGYKFMCVTICLTFLSSTRQLLLWQGF